MISMHGNGFSDEHSIYGDGDGDRDRDRLRGFGTVEDTY